MNYQDKSITKELIANSLEELLETKPIRQIRVTEIISKCGLSRQTFYRHFDDIYDLLLWLFYSSNDAQAFYDSQKDFEVSAIYCFSIMKERSKLFRRLLSTDTDQLFLNRLIRDRVEAGKRYIGAKNLNEDLSFSLLFFWTAYFHMVVRWLDSGMKESPERMGKLMFDCLPEALKKYYC